VISRLSLSGSRIPLPVWGGIILFVVYLLTLAPSVTFWDAGEFIAAAHSLGIPHPPGTPLFVLLLNVWAKLLFVLPYAMRTNLFSAVVTACAGGVTARLVQRATGNGSMALASGLAAGSMSSVWLNATETEVYAASLALGVAMIWAGERAGRERDQRWFYLLVYLIALAVPLHLSALVAAPVAIVLAGYSPVGMRWPVIGVLAGEFVLAMGVGRMSLSMSIAGATIIVAAMALRGTRDGRWTVRIPKPASSVLLIAALAFSALAFMYFRAQFDPAINQANPDTLSALADAVARRQYAVSPMWPREAPAWVQLGNLFQYADWQVALSFGPTVLPSILRTLGTVLFVALGWVGALTLWRTNRRFGIGVLGLLLCGALGVVVYLNLHAGPSIGYGFLSERTVREARERDYFFVFTFWAWGICAGVGAVSLATRWGRPGWTGVLVAGLPIVMNWRAVTRNTDPERSLPLAVADGLLESAPRNAVLFVSGDNDTYPLWYAQVVRRVRPDVALVTVPLLPTEWYRAEVSRRHFLLVDADVERYEGMMRTSAAIAARARRLGRPVAAAVSMAKSERDRIGKNWIASGLVYVERPLSAMNSESTTAGIDTVASKYWSEWIERRLDKLAVRPTIDPVNEYFRRMLDCPRQLMLVARHGESTPLDSLCNYR